MRRGRGWDVIVAGLGAMGSATVHALASRGARVLGLDRHDPPHTLGSTHGGTRIIREAYFEDPAYVPLVQRAIVRWRALEAETGESLYRETGGVMIGPEGGMVVAGALASARAHGLPHETMTPEALHERLPVFANAPGLAVLLEPRAGILFPERIVAATLRRARALGAELRTETPVLAWRAGDGGVRVTLPTGEEWADRLVLAAGAWNPALAGGALGAALRVERQVFHWFAPAPGAPVHAPEVMPVTLFEFAPGRMMAILPDVGDGVKAQVHHEGRLGPPDTVDRAVAPDEHRLVQRELARILPGAAGALRRSAVCLYTNTPDHHFLLDRHPDADRVTVVSPCSGHGFKFASAIGELAAAMTLDGVDAPPTFRAARMMSAPR